MRPAKSSSSLLPNVTVDCIGYANGVPTPVRDRRLGSAGDFSILLECGRAPARGHECAAGGKFCRAFYRALTIPAQASRYSGTDPYSVGNNRHARLRAERNGTGDGADRRPAALKAAHSRSVSKRRPRTSSAAGLAACRSRRSMRLLPSRAWKTRPSARNARLPKAATRSMCSTRSSLGCLTEASTNRRLRA